MTKQLLDPIVAQDLANTVNTKTKQAREATKNLNNMSDLYRSTTMSIDEKVILLSAGSISLLLTFIGILFNSQRKVSQLHYIFVILAVTSWLLSIVLLLISRWNQALYLSSTVHKHYLTALEEKTKAELEFYKVYPNIVHPDTLERFTEQELLKVIKDGDSQYKMIEDESKKTKRKEALHYKLNRYFNLSGHIFFIVGYILAAVFFLGVLNLMKH